MAECSGLGSRLKQIESATITTCGEVYPIDPFLTSNASFNNFFTQSVPDLTVMRVDVEVWCRVGDGSGRASFSRTGLFYREGGAVQSVHHWVDNHSIRSDKNFDLDYVLSATTVSFRVKSKDTTSATWKGCVHVYRVQ